MTGLLFNCHVLGDSIIALTRISIQSKWIADYACILKNKWGNVVDNI